MLLQLSNKEISEVNLPVEMTEFDKEIFFSQTLNSHRNEINCWGTLKILPLKKDVKKSLQLYYNFCTIYTISWYINDNVDLIIPSK